MELLHHFYTKTDDGKLIQNIILEFVSDNMEYKMDRYIKAKRNFTEKQIKVAISIPGINPCLIPFSRMRIRR